MTVVCARDLVSNCKLNKLVHVIAFVKRYKIDVAVAKLEIATWTMRSSAPRTPRMLTKEVQVTETRVVFSQ